MSAATFIRSASRVGNKLVCPDFQFQDQKFTVSTTNSLFCVWHENFAATYNTAVDDCRTSYGGAHLCSYSEMRRACVVAAFNPTINSWLADRSGDDSAVRTNIADCANFDGLSPAGTSLAGKYCCQEWPKY